MKLSASLTLACLALSGCTSLPSGERRIFADVAIGVRHLNEYSVGPRDTATIAVEHAWESGHYIRLEHNSHLSAGAPFSADEEDRLNQIQFGYRFMLRDPDSRPFKFEH